MSITAETLSSQRKAIMEENGKYLHEELSRQVIGAAIEVHRCLGPGLLESAYEVCLADEMQRRDIQFQRQVPLPVVFKDRMLDCGYRLDFLIENRLVLELKCVEKVIPIHEAQLLTYLKLSKKEVGLIINFCVPVLKEGIVRKALSNPMPSSATSASLR